MMDVRVFLNNFFCIKHFVDDGICISTLGYLFYVKTFMYFHFVDDGICIKTLWYLFSLCG